MQPTDNRKGMLAMLAAVACFTTTDVLMKAAAQSLPVSQVLALRGAHGLPPLAAPRVRAGLRADRAVPRADLAWLARDREPR
ncbi:MAG: hypothetical protein ACO27F_10280, partial [Beijerinckiaceae bacterium]